MVWDLYHPLGFNDASACNWYMWGGRCRGGEWTTIDGCIDIHLSYVEGDIITVIISNAHYLSVKMMINHGK